MRPWAQRGGGRRGALGEQAAGSESGSQCLGSIAVFNSGGAGGERLAARHRGRAASAGH